MLSCPLTIDEFFSAEGTSEEEWKRVYDLRYCTILVPFEDEARSESPKAKHDNFTTEAHQEQEEQDNNEMSEEKQIMSKTMSGSIVTKCPSPEPVHLATPRATPARYCTLFVHYCC